MFLYVFLTNVFFYCFSAKFIPSDGVFTKTVNIGDTGVVINMTSVGDPESSDSLSSWRKDGDDEITSQEGLTSFVFHDAIRSSDAGIYEIYYGGERRDGRGSLYRLIVRGMQST